MGSSDEAAILSLYQQKIYGWNSRNGKAFAAPYTVDGTYLKGRQEIASLHQMLFDKFIKGNRLVGKIRSIRFLTYDIAIVVAVGDLTRDGWVIRY